MADVESKLAALTTMSSAQLRDEWRSLTGAVCPRISPALLRLALAWEIQAKAYGGLSRATTQKLDQLGRGLTRTTPARPGMRLVREWAGKAHVVTISEDANGNGGVSRSGQTPNRSAVRSIIRFAAVTSACRTAVLASTSMMTVCFKSMR